MKTRDDVSENHTNGSTPILEARVDDRQATIALRKLYRRESFEPSTNITPIDEVFAIEESPLCPHCRKPVDSPGQFRGSVETVRRLAEFCAQDGVHWLDVLRNLYTVFAYMGLPLFTGLRLRERAAILGDSHGSEHLRAERVVNFVRRGGAYSFKAPGQKSIKSRESFSNCQRGNKNRKRQNRSRHCRWKQIEKKQRKT
jgi:hypothetical protein